MFDSKVIFGIKVLGGKRCEVRYPADAEWCARERSMSVIQRGLGRGTQSEGRGVEAANAKLFAAIRQDTGPEFDEAETAKVLEKLARADVVDARNEGGVFAVDIEVIGGQTVTLKMRFPSLRQHQKFSRDSVSVMSQGRDRIIRTFLEPALELWKDIQVEAAGYSGDVPVVHIEAALAELSRAIEREDEDPEEMAPTGPTSRG